jgi:hypothetical protein
MGLKYVYDVIFISSGNELPCKRGKVTYFVKNWHIHTDEMPSHWDTIHYLKTRPAAISTREHGHQQTPFYQFDGQAMSQYLRPTPVWMIVPYGKKNARKSLPPHSVRYNTHLKSDALPLPTFFLYSHDLWGNSVNASLVCPSDVPFKGNPSSNVSVCLGSFLVNKWENMLLFEKPNGELCRGPFPSLPVESIHSQ